MRATLKSALALLVIAGLSLTGTVAVAVVGTWGPTITLADAGWHQPRPQLVTDGTTITAIWQDGHSARSDIQVSSSTDEGGTWSTPVPLTEVGQQAGSPQLVTDGTTRTASWHFYDGANWRIQASSSTDGGATWSTPVTLSDAGQHAFRPQLVTDGTTITATWAQFDGSHDRVQASSSTDGGATWSPPATLSAAGQTAYAPRLVTDGTTISAVWYRDDYPNGTRIQVSSSTDGGATWSPPVTLTEPDQHAKYPQLVTDGTTITAIWQMNEVGKKSGVQTSSSTDGGATWRTPATLSETGRHAWYPQLVTDGTTITAVWYGEIVSGGHKRIKASSSTDGGATWSTPVTVSEDGVASDYYPQVVTDGTTITAAWYRTDSAAERVQVSSSTDGGATWSTPVNLSDPFKDAACTELVTDGITITVAWCLWEDDHWRVQVASSLIVSPDDPATYSFSDVPTTHPFYDEIMWLAASGITGGYDDGTFRPSAAVTRQAMSAFLYRAAGSPAHEPPATSPFTDVSTTHPFYAAITWMASEEISTGYDDGTFRSSDPVTRQAMSAFLYRAAGSPAHTPPTVSPFSDVATTHPFYLEITWMAESGISTGYTDGTFKPSNAVTRQAMAAFLQRMDALVV